MQREHLLACLLAVTWFVRIHLTGDEAKNSYTSAARACKQSYLCCCKHMTHIGPHTLTIIQTLQSRLPH